MEQDERRSLNLTFAEQTFQAADDSDFLLDFFDIVGSSAGGKSKNVNSCEIWVGRISDRTFAYLHPWVPVQGKRFLNLGKC